MRQLVMFLCCFLSVGSAMLLETDEGVERRLLGNSSSNHTSFLHLTFINPFSNYHYLMHLFSRGNIAAPAFLLLFWAVVPFLMTLLAFLDGRPVVVMQSVAIWRLHLLSYGLVTYSSARDAPRAAVLGNDSVSQSVFSRRKPLLKLVKFLVFKLWDRIRSCHTWISVLSPPLEHRLTISRCQRAALLGVEMMANAVFVCITLGRYVFFVCACLPNRELRVFLAAFKTRYSRSP